MPLFIGMIRPSTLFWLSLCIFCCCIGYAAKKCHISHQFLLSAP